MQKWHEYANYRNRKNEDSTLSYFIIVDGTEVEVSEVIYTEYSKASRKMKYIELDIKCSSFLKDKSGRTILEENKQPIILPERESPLDKLIDEDNWDFPSDELSVEEAAILNIEVEQLHKCLALLSAEERQLIESLFFDGLSEREYSAVCGIAQTTINSRKKKILGKLNKLFKK